MTTHIREAGRRDGWRNSNIGRNVRLGLASRGLDKVSVEFHTVRDRGVGTGRWAVRVLLGGNSGNGEGRQDSVIPLVGYPTRSAEEGIDDLKMNPIVVR